MRRKRTMLLATTGKVATNKTRGRAIALHRCKLIGPGLCARIGVAGKTSSERNADCSSHLPVLSASSVKMNMAHLKLFHHFITAMGPSIGVEDDMQALWTEIVPQIAFKHDFLMHSLLAVSALHTAHINPEHRDLYSEQAVSHQNQASRLAQNEMMNANPSNADALFAYSITTMWYSFASHAMPHMEISRRPLQGAIQTINLLRGIRTIGPSVKDWTWKGVRISPSPFRFPYPSAFHSASLIPCMPCSVLKDTAHCRLLTRTSHSPSPL